MVLCRGEKEAVGVRIDSYLQFSAVGNCMERQRVLQDDRDQGELPRIQSTGQSGSQDINVDFPFQEPGY